MEQDRHGRYFSESSLRTVGFPIQSSEVSSQCVNRMMTIASILHGWLIVSQYEVTIVNKYYFFIVHTIRIIKVMDCNF